MWLFAPEFGISDKKWHLRSRRGNDLAGSDESLTALCRVNRSRRALLMTLKIPVN